LTAEDQFSRDPQVRTLRAIFARLEETSLSLVAEMGLSPLDPRLGAWRKRALDIFERAWGQSARQGLSLGPEEIAALYCRALMNTGAAEFAPNLPPERFGPPELDRLVPLP
jgi:hypothetical protein